MLTEALAFWAAQPDGAPLKPHLRSAVIQSFEFTYELSVRLLRRVLIERSESADRVADLSFNDLLRAAADAGLLADAPRWREWREMRNATSHAYDEARAQAVAQLDVRDLVRHRRRLHQPRHPRRDEQPPVVGIVEARDLLLEHGRHRDQGPQTGRPRTAHGLGR